jgi:hypothetical protein
MNCSQRPWRPGRPFLLSFQAARETNVAAARDIFVILPILSILSILSIPLLLFRTWTGRDGCRAR